MTSTVRLIFGLLLASLSGSLFAVTEIKIGVLAYRGSLVTHERWQATADYLSSQIPGMHFQIVPVSNDTIETLVKNAEIDLIITNPGSYALLESRYGVTRVLTLVNAYPQGSLTQYGGVIITKAGRNDISTLEDLRGKTLAAVHKDAFGGWWVAWRELLQHGIDVDKDLHMIYSGFPQDQIVDWVLQGKADAGVMRTQVLERMADEGGLNLSLLRVINYKKTFAFPFALSTPLYPEWPLAMLKHVPGELTEKVVLALLAMPRNHPAAQQANISGWTVPLDYLPVQQLMQELHVGHYQNSHDYTLAQAMRKYWPQTLLLSTLLTMLVVTVLFVLNLNNHLRRSRDMLQREMAAKEKAQHESGKLGRILDACPSEILVFNLVTEKMLHANTSAKSHLGDATQSLESVLLYDLFPDLPDHIRAKIRAASSQQDETSILYCESRVHRRNGGDYLAALQMQIYQDERGPTLVCIAQDISAFKKTEQKLERARERAESTLQSITDGLISTDAQGKIEYMNQVAESLTGWTAADARNQPINDVVKLIDPESGKAIANSVHLGVTDKQLALPEKECLLVGKNGHTLAINESAVPRYDPQGELSGLVMLLRDHSDMHQLNERTQYFLTHDDLTGLINRRVFENEVKEALRSANLNQTQHALLQLCLDELKFVMDSCGSQGADELIKQLTFQLKAMLRGCDTLSRLGEDVFGVLLRGCTLEDAQLAATRMQEMINLYPFAWNGKVNHIGASIGVVPIAAGIGKLQDVLHAADIAANTAKTQGRNRIHIHDDAGSSEYTEELFHGLNARVLKEALRENRFSLYFQTIAPLAHNTKHHYSELLLRLHDIRGEIIMPAVFIPVAERFQLMPELDKWVLTKAFAFMQEKNLTQFRFSINLSGQSLCEDGFLHFVTENLRRYRIPPGTVCFDIREDTATAHFRETLRFINALRDSGVTFALDDFGSGLSSFHYLKRLQPDFLKIDGSFVRNMLRDSKDYAIVESLNNTAHMLGMQTVAENVENAKIKKELSRIGVDFAQGFDIAKPRPLNELLASSPS